MMLNVDVLQQALLESRQEKPARRQDAQHPYKKPDYWTKIQMTKHDESEQLEPKEIMRLQQVIGKFLWYAKAIDNMMLVALRSLAAAQTKGTKQTAKAL
jgi:hypothetical protein